MKATVTTYRTAKKYGVDDELASIGEMFADFGESLGKPTLDSTSVSWLVDGEAVDSLEIVKVTCDCGEQFGTLIYGDEMSSLYEIKCPCCGQTSRDYEYDDKLSFRRNR